MTVAARAGRSLPMALPHGRSRAIALLHGWPAADGFSARTPSPQGRFWVCGAACAGPNQASWPRDVTVVLNLVFYQSCNGMDRCILPVSLVITHTQGR